MATMEDIAKRLGVSKGPFPRRSTVRRTSAQHCEKPSWRPAVELGYTRARRGAVRDALRLY